MEMLKGEPMVCPVDQHCSEWARSHMSYCLCDWRDWFSLVLGLISVLSWVVAEIPQIITNSKRKSSEGISIYFLMTWIVGDFFNLFGCILEPETLPTQYYTAVLYTITTLLLFSQAAYYGHIYPRLKSNRRQEAVETMTVERTEQTYGSVTEKANNVETWTNSESSTVPVASGSPNRHEDIFFMSARSLSVSHTPPSGSFLASRIARLDVEGQSAVEPLLGEVRSTQSSSPKIKTTLCVVSFMTFFLGGCKQQLAESRKIQTTLKGTTGGVVLRVGRRILEATRGSAPEPRATGGNGIGTYLGWGMAAIYMGGRLPQICLNMKRGNAEGLNPLMFVFALLGNGTYVASILVRSLEWSKIRPNIPWLVESGGCMLLDILIVIQFICFRYKSRRQVEKYVS